MLIEKNILIDDSENVYFTLLDSKSIPQSRGRNARLLCLSFPLEWNTIKEFEKQ